MLRVTYQVVDNIAFVKLSRAEKHNALDMPMFRQLCQVQQKIRKDKQVRCVILSAQGEDFCTGLDVKSVMNSARDAIRLLVKWPWQPNMAQQVSVGWQQLPVPVIAVVQGRCWGGGLQIALGADIRYVTEDATFSIMEMKWGLIPDMGGTLAFRSHMRKDVALSLAMSAAEVDATQALQWGLVTKVCKAPLKDAKTYAEQVLTKNPDAIAGVKKLYQKSWQGSQAMALFREFWYQCKVLMGRNQRIAVKKQQGKAADYQPRGRW